MLATLVSNAWVILMRYLLLGAPLGMLITGVAFTFGRAVLDFVLYWLGLSVRLSVPGSPAFFFLCFLVVSWAITLVFLFAEAEVQLHHAEQWVWQHERIPPLEARVVKGYGGGVKVG